jgi:hypothetical protein
MKTNKDQDAYQNALAKAPRNPDGGVDESMLQAQLMEEMEFDPDAAKEAKAREIINRHKRPGQTTPDGQLALEGMEPYAYEPDRLIPYDGKKVIENSKARPDHKGSDAQRAQAKAERYQLQAKRRLNEYKPYADWAMVQLMEGKSADVITFDTFIRETLRWNNGPAGAEDDPSDGDDR